MGNNKVNIRYAKALFDLSVEQNLIEECFADMKFAIEICEQSKDFVMMLASPIIHEKKKISIVKQVFEEKIQPISLNFISLIIKKRREINLKDIAQAYIELYKEYKNIKTLKLYTPVPVDDEIRTKIIQIATEQTQANIELEEYIDESLIGGFVLNLGDVLFDNSLANKIRKLKADFSKNIYEKGF